MLAGGGRALALAPHPDDPDAVAICLRLLAQCGWELHWHIVTSGWSGVLDDFVGKDRVAKGRIREEEQSESARRFGLPEDHLRFLRLTEDSAGELAETKDNRRCFTHALNECQPQLVMLPSPQDSNPTHRLVAHWFADWAGQYSTPCVAWYNEDPKTSGMRVDLLLPFDETLAAWKADLCDCHHSQTARNMVTRGQRLSDRILAVNRAAGSNGGYAERFQIECWPGRASLAPMQK